MKTINNKTTNLLALLVILLLTIACWYLLKTNKSVEITHSKTLIDSLQQRITSLEQSNILYGKKWAACGDSFTAGDFTGIEDSTAFIFQEGLYKGEKKVYPYYIGRRNHMNVLNFAQCGATMALWKEYVLHPSENSINGHTPFSHERYKNIPDDVDYITLWFGINDAANTILGTINDTTNTTYYGAWNTVLPYLIEHHPYAKIGIIITNQSSPSYRQATRQIAQRWGIPYLDMMGDQQIVPIFGKESNQNLSAEADSLRKSFFQVTEENDHPNADAHQFESTFIEAWMRTL